jgi:hypothetical protein
MANLQLTVIITNKGYDLFWSRPKRYKIKEADTRKYQPLHYLSNDNFLFA